MFESFVFGAANSVHCAFMCGPLSLATGCTLKSSSAYHGCRLISYGALGVALGGIGAAVGTRELQRGPQMWVAFVLAGGLLVLTFVGERGAVRIPGIGRVLQGTMARARQLPPAARQGLLGLVTPLLPCGLLWAACAAAAVAGSAWDGGAVMTGFALGSLPLLLLAQTQAGRLLRRFSPSTLAWVQKGAMLLAAAMLLWRGIVSAQGSSCCH